MFNDVILSEEQKALVEATNLTNEQYDNFLEHMERIPSVRSPINGKTARLVFEFMEDTGCRVTETIHIKKEDVDFRTRILTVTRPKSEKRCKCSRWKNRDEHSQVKVLEYADTQCDKCHGKGKWKKPQRTTITPRLYWKLREYCDTLKDGERLFPISRISLWTWGKDAGERAGINIFQQKEERLIEGIFLHLFRALCSLRTTRDAKNDLYQTQIVDCKMRHAYDRVGERYNRVDINYLINWENKVYGDITLDLQ